MQPKTKKEETPMTTDNTTKISELNDLCRKAMGDLDESAKSVQD